MVPNSVSYCRAEPSKVLAAAPRPRKKGRFRVAISDRSPSPPWDPRLPGMDEVCFNQLPHHHAPPLYVTPLTPISRSPFAPPYFPGIWILRRTCAGRAREHK